MTLCPCCGYSLELDCVIERDGWRIDPVGVVEYQGERLRMRSSWAAILHTLATSNTPVGVDALLNRVSRTENPKAMHVTICQMRKWLREQGWPSPIMSARHWNDRGYAWAG